jgi:iron complex outermembrane recepter protein
MMHPLRRTLIQLVRLSADSNRYSAKCSLAIASLLCCIICKAQNNNTAASDTASLNAVTVTAFASGLKWKDVPASVAVLNKQQLQRYDGTSLVPLLNTVAGVRMEERSPGSYRLSMRGSLLRSPFGVRNVKIYMDDVPLTDATGNTYLNLIDLNELKSVEIIKGPSSSFYGANTGGAVILNTDDVRGVDAGLSGGSFGLFKEYVSIKQRTDKFFFGLQQSHTQSDGYRQQSALRRDIIQANLKWRMNKTTSLSILGFYANLHYETPGGITQAQMDSLLTLARQPSGSTPGAVQQNTGVHNKTYFGASTFRSAFAKHFDNTTSFVFNHTDFQNPFITNYEKRKEFNYSGRTDFQYTLDKGTGFTLKANAGGELQYNNSFIRVYDNNGGTIGDNQFKDRVHTTQYFLFAQVNITTSKWVLQAGLSANNIRYWYNRISVDSSIYPSVKKAGPTVSPRFGIVYKLTKAVSLYASAAKGFSPPTLAEVLPSSGVFFEGLEPESGWNYEAGIKGAAMNSRLQYNLSVYYFALKNAIVRRNDANGAEYFINAGGTIQKGAELWLNANIMHNKSGFIQSLNVWNSFSLQPYRFDDYKLAGNDYSGNKLTGVPRTINVSGVDIKFIHEYFLNITFNYTSSISLNDAATVSAKPYHLLQLKMGKDFVFTKMKLKVFAGADNLLNEVYSMGNDINAFGGRYFNPAPKRNYYGGVAVSF